MLSAFETMARANPMRVCFAAVDAEGNDVPYGYQQARLISSAIAWRLQEFGATKGTYVLVDLPSIAIYPLLILAAAYGGFGLIPLDYRLSAAEKSQRKAEFRRTLGADLAYSVDKTNVMPLMRWAIDFLAGKQEVRTQQEGSLGANLTQRTLGGKAPRNSLSFSTGRRKENSQANMSANAQSTCIHFADRQAHLFNAKAPAFIFSATDERGRTRAVCHSWSSVLENAYAANDALAVNQLTVWQCVLPLWTVEGVQVVLRGFAGGNSFVLYRRFNPYQVLNDISRYRVTHIAVDAAQLSSMLQVGARQFGRYGCVLLEGTEGGANLDQGLFRAARQANPHVRVTYSLPETAGMVAVEDDIPHSSSAPCAMRPLPGCDVRALGPDAQGFGSLGVKTPGLFAGYLDSTPIRMRNGYYLTGDIAAVYRDYLYMR